MLPRRRYSSLARQAAARIASISTSATPQPASRPLPTTKGRLTPSRTFSIGTRLLVAKLSRSTPWSLRAIDILNPPANLLARTTNGRRRLSLARRDSRGNTGTRGYHPEVPYPGFMPIRLNPAQTAMHMAFNPPHMPLPLYLGTDRYARPPPASPPNLSPSSIFAIPSPAPPKFEEEIPDDVVFANPPPPSAFRDHLDVIFALSSSDHSHHLGGHVDTSQFLSSFADPRPIEETPWDMALRKLHEPIAQGFSSVPPIAETKADLQGAVAGLELLLDRLKISGPRKGRKPNGEMVQLVGADREIEWVSLDSTRRKRKKKMNKQCVVLDFWRKKIL